MDRRKLLLVAAVIVALFGAGLVFLYVQGADKRAADRYDSVEVLTVVSPIMTGESISQAAADGKIQRTRLPRAAVLPGALGTIDSLAGLAANTNLYAGEQIVADKFGGVGEAAALPIPEGMMAISVELTDASRVAGFVQAGSDVAIWLTGDRSALGDEQGGGFSRLVIPQAKVLAAGSTTLVSTSSTDATGTETVEQLPRTLLTLAVDQEQAEKIKLAATLGELSFGLTTEQSKVRPSEGRNADNLFK